jgi:hypothetical protein
MALVGKLTTLFQGDTRGLDEASRGALKQLNQVQRQVMSLSKNMEGAFNIKGGDGGGLMGGLGKVGLAGMGMDQIVGKITQVAGIAVDAAKNADKLAASGRSIGVIFGPAAETVMATIGKLNTELGLSQINTQQLAVQIGANLTNAGLEGATAADMTGKLLERAADMALATGYSVDEAIGGIASALRGEFDPIERFGIGLKATAIEAEALRMGAVKVDGAFSQQEKTLATINLLMQQSAKYQGAAAANSDTATVAVDKLNAAWEQMSVAVGKVAAPAIVFISNMIRALIKDITWAANQISKLWGGGGGEKAKATLAAPVEQLNKALDQTPEKLSKIAKITTETQKRWESLADALKAAGSLSDDLVGRKMAKMFGADSDVMNLVNMVRGGARTDRVMGLATELDRINAMKSPAELLDQSRALARADTMRPGLFLANSRESYAAEISARTGASGSKAAESTAKNTASAADTLRKILDAMKAQPELAMGF